MPQNLEGMLLKEQGVEQQLLRRTGDRKHRESGVLLPLTVAAGEEGPGTRRPGVTRLLHHRQQVIFLLWPGFLQVVKVG